MTQDLQDSSGRDCDHKASCGCPILLQSRQAYCLAFPEECICPPNIVCMHSALCMQGQPSLEQEQETCNHECLQSVAGQQQLPLLQMAPANHCKILESGQGLLPALKRSAETLLFVQISRSRQAQLHYTWAKGGVSNLCTSVPSFNKKADMQMRPRIRPCICGEV